MNKNMGKHRKPREARGIVWRIAAGGVIVGLLGLTGLAGAAEVAVTPVPVAQVVTGAP